MTRPRIELHIEELVLEGFEPADRHRIGDAVERELARLFGAQGLPTHFAESIEVERIDGGAFQVGRGARAEAIGAQVSRVVFDRLNFMKTEATTHAGGEK